jgi:hypothetical protein
MRRVKSTIRSIRFAMLSLCASLLIIFCGTGNLRAGTFQNLGFEDAVIGTPSGHSLPASQATPHWTNCYSLIGYDFIYYDTTALSSLSVSIHDALASDQIWGTPYRPLIGNYSVVLHEGSDGEGNVLSSWIAQTGDVPSSARSLMFKTDMAQYVNRLVVSLNGTAIPMRLYSTDGTVNSSWGPIETFIGDIAAFAGQQDVELRFTKLVQDPSHPYVYGVVDIDAIQFSSIIVPEPSTIALLAVAMLGGIAYVLRRARRLPSSSP